MGERESEGVEEWERKEGERPQLRLKMGERGKANC